MGSTLKIAEGKVMTTQPQLPEIAEVCNNDLEMW